MADSFRWRLSGNRDDLLKALEDATRENTKAKALEVAVVAYLQLIGDNIVEPGTGSFEQLLVAADERGSLRAGEIAELLSADELPIQYEPANWAIGEVDD